MANLRHPADLFSKLVGLTQKVNGSNRQRWKMKTKTCDLNNDRMVLPEQMCCFQRRLERQ